MSAAPFASVVVATRGRPEALQVCLEALDRQVPPPGGFEVVVVDDSGGGDGPGRLPPGVRTIAGKGIGPAAARNLGAQAARGEVLLFTDDDCLPAPEWVGRLAAQVASEPGALVAGRTVNGSPDNVLCVASQAVLDAAHVQVGPNLEPLFVASCNLAVSAAAFAGVGGFEPSFRHAEDRDLCLRWRAVGRPLRWVPGAEVEHRRPMGPAGFVRQHLGYGRGAYAVHRRVPGSGLVPPPRSDFYAALAREVVRVPRGRARVAGLAVVSQLVAAVGFALEALARHGVGRRRCAPPSLPMPVQQQGADAVAADRREPPHDALDLAGATSGP